MAYWCSSIPLAEKCYGKVGRRLMRSEEKCSGHWIDTLVEVCNVAKFKLQTMLYTYDLVQRCYWLDPAVIQTVKNYKQIHT